MIHWLNLETLLLIVKQGRSQAAKVSEELCCYSSITAVNLKQAHAVRSIFDPLVWWGEQ